MVKLYTKNGQVKLANRIVIITEESQIINPTHEMLLEAGWVEYVAPEVEPQPYRKSESEVMQEIVLEQYNSRTDIEDKEALDRAIVIYNWDKYIGKSLKTGQVVVHDERVYRVRQDIPIVLDKQYPSLDTAAIYEVIELVATGEIDDPIKYTPPMEIFKDKYYLEEDSKYLCTRDSGIALSHNLSSLIGLYVELVD